jgi:antitoxin component YwqK of YwqJK toxin-antitoxin module
MKNMLYLIVSLIGTIIISSCSLTHQTAIKPLSGPSIDTTKIDTLKTYFPDGKISEIYTGIRLKDGTVLKHGIYQMYNENGIKIYEYEIKLGKKNGYYKTWYENGNKEVEGYYKNGVEDSVVTWWFINGFMQKHETYKEGKKNGPYWEHYDNEIIKCEGNYTNGVENGTFKEYYQNGDPKLLRIYENGNLIKEEKEFKKIRKDAVKDKDTF